MDAEDYAATSGTVILKNLKGDNIWTAIDARGHILVGTDSGVFRSTAAYTGTLALSLEPSEFGPAPAMDVYAWSMGDGGAGGGGEDGGDDKTRWDWTDAETGKTVTECY